MRTAPFIALILVGAIASAPARSELVIGGYPPNGGSHWIRQFAANAQDPATPIREISGAATTISDSSSASYESVEGLVYVSDFYGSAIRVFDAFASGNVAPLRVINPPSLGQARANVPIPIHDELIVIGSNCCLFTYPLHGDGNAVPQLRQIFWGGGGGPTQLNNPSGLIWLPDSDELAVVDYDISPPYAAKIVFHARTASGAATPTRVLKGANTANAAGLAHDPVQHRLYVLTFSTNDGGLTYDGQVRVFADSAANDDAPLATIEGPATQLGFDSGQYPSGLGIDADLQRIMVGYAANGNPATNRVISFDLGATGNATPVQVLSGTSLSPNTIGTPFAIPLATIFANGFDN